MSDLDESLNQIRESRRLVQESRNELRRATGNPLEPLAFPRRTIRRAKR